ncbi:MAG: hypothetical protein ACP5UT_18540 [Bryobacteraceae bacterium]
MPIYRAVAEGGPLGPFSILQTRRAPTNIHYLVDNLWEWKRPDVFPSRRHAVFASPSPELALASATAAHARAYRVVIESGEPCAQIVEQDAKDTEERKTLPRLIFRLLGEQEFLSAPLEKKSAVAPLFCPCLTKEEVEQLFRTEPLAGHREAVWSAIHFWERAKLFSPHENPPFPEGEVFFCASRYRLEPL